jgi:hypothetical protein
MAGRFLHRALALGLISAAALGAFTGAEARADTVTAAQRRAAGEFLAAVAAGNAQAIAYAIHPGELDRLRLSVMARLREEAARGESTLRARLFGPAVPLDDVERMTSLSFYQAVGRRLSLRARAYEEVEGVGAVREADGVVHVLVRGRQPKERGQVRVVELVTLMPYGKEWKATLPGEIEARLEDLLAGRAEAGRPGSGTAEPAVAAAGSGGGGQAGAAVNSREILGLLDAAEKALVEGRCEDYYRQHLSPTLRDSLSARALASLVASCRNSIANRELLIAALRIVRKLPPRYDMGGSRASYDVSGQGLAYDRFILEQVAGRWYVAE